MKRLTALLREPLIPLYITFPDLALRFCVAMFHAIFEEKITTASEAGEEEVRRSWEGVQGSLLSGVLVCHVFVYAAKRTYQPVGFY
jgi:hypothetical protein